MTNPPDERELDEQELDALVKQWAEGTFGIGPASPEEQSRRREIVKRWILSRELAWKEICKPIDPALAPFKPTERELRDYCLLGSQRAINRALRA